MKNSISFYCLNHDQLLFDHENSKSKEHAYSKNLINEDVLVVFKFFSARKSMKELFTGFCTGSHGLFEYIQENSFPLYSRRLRSKIPFSNILSLVDANEESFSTVGRCLRSYYRNWRFSTFDKQYSFDRIISDLKRHL